MNSKPLGVIVMVESKNDLHNGLKHLNIQSEVSFSLRLDKHQNWNLKIKCRFQLWNMKDSDAFLSIQSWKSSVDSDEPNTTLIALYSAHKHT